MNRHWGVSIGDVVDVVRTWNPQRDGRGIFNYIDLSAVDQEAKAIVAASSIACSAAPSRARQLVQTDDILVSTVRPNLNAVAHVSGDFDGATASTGFCVLRPSPKRLDPRYLLHWVRAPAFVDSMVRSATGASYPAVSDRIVKESVIPLPPLDEQRRIAAILDKADALRQKRKRVIALLDSLTQSIFREMFGDPIANSGRLPTLPLRALVEPERGIPYGIVQRGPDQEAGIPVVRIGDFADGRLSTRDLRLTTNEISERYARTILAGGEILISIRGTVGRCALVPEQAAGANVSREVAVIPTKEPALNPFLLALLRCAPVQRAIADDVKGVAQSGINLEDLRELPVIQPSSAKLEAFIKAATILENKSQAALLACSETERLFFSLQQRAFHGQL